MTGRSGHHPNLSAMPAFSSVMPDLATYLAFLAAVLVMQVTPGPDMALVIGRGVGQGRRVAFCTVLGFMVAGLIQVPLLVLGIASLLHASPLAFDLMRWLGAAYLIWLGARLLWSSRQGSSLAQSAAGARSSALSAVRDGLINNLTNPKALLFMFAFLPQFVSPDRGSVAAQLLVLGLTQKATGLLVQGSVALASGAVGGWLARKPGFLVWQERFAGFVMVGLGLRLLLAGDGRPART
jgi:threonine/homoserine/homoserine lactone efflux protein